MVSSLEQILKVPKLKSECHVAVGIRPSGSLHIGNLLTCALSSMLASPLCTKKGHVTVTLCDIDMPGPRLWNSAEHGFVKYFDSLPVGYESGESAYQKTHAQTTFVFEELSSLLNVKYTIKRLSDTQKHPAYRKALKALCDNHSDQNKSNKSIFSEMFPKFNSNTVPLYPLCPTCTTSSLKASSYENGKLYTSCKNPQCSKGDFSTDIMDPSRVIAVNYLIDPIRDITADVIDVHVFGGDYEQTHRNTSNQTKIELVRKAQQYVGNRIGASPPYLVQGPLIAGVGNAKISKSDDLDKYTYMYFAGRNYQREGMERVGPMEDVLRLIGGMIDYRGLKGMPVLRGKYVVDLDRHSVIPTESEKINEEKRFHKPERVIHQLRDRLFLKLLEKKRKVFL